MDTRDKILEPGSPWADFPRPLVVVTGYFDVLRAEHARELKQAREAGNAATLLAIVRAGEGKLLPLRARAELVAALGTVDYVACGEGKDDLRPDSLVNLEAREDALFDELRAKVRNSKTATL